MCVFYAQNLERTQEKKIVSPRAAPKSVDIIPPSRCALALSEWSGGLGKLTVGGAGRSETQLRHVCW